MSGCVFDFFLFWVAFSSWLISECSWDFDPTGAADQVPLFLELSNGQTLEINRNWALTLHEHSDSMATSLVLPHELRPRLWHDDQRLSGPCPTAQPSSSPSSNLASTTPMATGNAESQKPSLPSFDSFVNSATPGSLNFAQQSSASNRGVRSLAAHATASHHAAEANSYVVPPTVNPAPYPGPASQPYGHRPDPDRTLYWPHPNSLLPESRATFPSAPPSLPTPASTYNRKVVGEEAVPSKGTCYIYDDGGVCQKTIDGDTVNPKWGTTKAGKPRKRLGQACNTCREKKIKCDPSTPKCAQCQKFGRECKFDST